MSVSAALVLVLQAAGASTAAPPRVVMTPDQERKFSASMPLITINGKSFRVFAIRGTGDRDALDNAAKKLSAEGWSCNVAKDHTGELNLAVFAQGKTLAEVQQLARRFEAHEFGAIQARPMLFPNEGAG